MDNYSQFDLLSQQVIQMCRRLLSEQDRDSYSPTRGCFDRRFWGWKIADFPEATYQRNVLPLAWLLKNKTTNLNIEKEVLIDAIIAGLKFSIKIQHKNGSFDQAFPNEYSFGATAFLIHPLLLAYEQIKEYVSEDLQIEFEEAIRKAAIFLCQNNEEHGLISNHLAGAALSLAKCGEFLSEQMFIDRANYLIERVIENQNKEGWYIEYDGADPGYQTLCVYYLAQYFETQPDMLLEESLNKSIHFLVHFVHPDGSFAGEYGSRKTNICYPGGLAALSAKNQLARMFLKNMIESICNGKTIGLEDIDMGNMAPLLSNYILLLDKFEDVFLASDSLLLPYEENSLLRYFKEAGIFIYGCDKYYAVLGVSGGGLIKVFDKRNKKIVCNDFGYVASLTDGELLTNQSLGVGEYNFDTENTIKVDAWFRKISDMSQTPFKFIILRILNLTFMRSITIGNFFKKMMVFMLMKQKKDRRIKVRREISFYDDAVLVEDKIKLANDVVVEKLESGRQFISIHMASSRYYPQFVPTRKYIQSYDVEQLNKERVLSNRMNISFRNENEA